VTIFISDISEHLETKIIIGLSKFSDILYPNVEAQNILGSDKNGIPFYKKPIKI
jgi:hypothetical protein